MASLQAHSASSKAQIEDEVHVHHAQKLKELKEELANVGEEDQLIVVDAMQRLGVDYHFQEEIEAILQKQYKRAYNDQYCNQDLLEVSLRFRLLRQNGYHVTADVLINKFKKKIEKTGLEKDVVNGLVGVYEASHLSFEGEDTLDEAGELSHQLLSSWVPNINVDDHHKARVVTHALEHPYHKSLTRFMAKPFLNNFQFREKWASVLKELAKLEFNMVESVIRNEILQISEWWEELGLAKELKFVRDQPMKWYTWPMACLADPSLSEERVELTKSISLVYIIDDIFDVHGTLDELTLFTAAVERWDTAAIDELPNYMKICFKALYDITNETSESVYRRHGWNPIESLKQSWARLCNAFLLEAKWFTFGHMPNTEDYLKNGAISTGVPTVLTHGFFILGRGITKKNVDTLNKIPGIISSTATILRLWDDFGSAEDENQTGYDGSYIQCYMKEHEGCSVEEAQAYVIQKISDEWKQLNQECFSSSNPFSASFTKLALNVARMVPMMYDYNAHHRLPSLEENMKSLLFDSFLAQGFTQGQLA